MPAEDEQIRLTLTTFVMLVVGSRERSLPEWRQEESQLLMVSMERGGCEGELETMKQGQSREDEVGTMK